MTDPIGAPPPAPRKPGGLGAWALGAWVGTLVVLLVVFAWLMGKDEGRRQAESSTPTQQVAEKPAPAAAKTTPAAAPAGPGQELFAATCGGCHTLAAADAHGTMGPSLDDLKPDAARVQAAITNGGTGGGAMPKDLLQGEQATQVADYVAKAAGGG